MQSGTDKQMAVDRRRHMRFDCPLSIMVKPSNNSRSFVSGAMKNFSRHGFCFEIQAIPLKELQTLECRIKMPTEDRFATVQGEVVWTRNEGDKLSAGVRIHDMDGADKCKILDFGYDTWIEKVIKRKKDRIVSIY